MIRQSLGAHGERRAESFLAGKGLICLQRNYRCRLGEIDLVMRDGEELVFVEVRLRRRSGFGDGVDSIGRHKRHRLIRAARHFLMRHDEQDDVPCRFDVVAVDRGSDHIEWISNAFEVDE